MKYDGNGDVKISSWNNETVMHPAHYTGGDIECIEAIKSSMTSEAFLGYLKGNVMKYLWRYEKKDHAEEDLAKANWYLARIQKEIGVPATWGDEISGTYGRMAGRSS